MNTIHTTVDAGIDQAPVAAGPDATAITLEQAFRALMFVGLYVAVRRLDSWLWGSCALLTSQRLH